MTIYLAPLVALLGLLTYAFAPAKPAELGRLAFAAGLLVSLLEFSGKYHVP